MIKDQSLSTLPGYVSGTYTCTVFKDNTYPHSGGIISVTVTPTQHDVIDGNWIHIVENDIYHILPDEFVLVPHSPIIGDIKFIVHPQLMTDEFLLAAVDRIFLLQQFTDFFQFFL